MIGLAGSIKKHPVDPLSDHLRREPRPVLSKSELDTKPVPNERSNHHDSGCYQRNSNTAFRQSRKKQGDPYGEEDENTVHEYPEPDRQRTEDRSQHDSILWLAEKSFIIEA